MSDVIVVQPVTQSLTVSPVSPVITISASGPQGATGVVSANSPLSLSGSGVLSLSYSSLVINGGTP